VINVNCVIYCSRDEEEIKTVVITHVYCQTKKNMSSTNPQAVLQALSDEYQKLQTGRSRQHGMPIPQAYTTAEYGHSQILAQQYKHEND